MFNIMWERFYVGTILCRLNFMWNRFYVESILCEVDFMWELICLIDFYGVSILCGNYFVGFLCAIDFMWDQFYAGMIICGLILYGHDFVS